MTKGKWAEINFGREPTAPTFSFIPSLLEHVVYSFVTMAPKGFFIVLLVSFFGLQGAMSCFDDKDCLSAEYCCSDGICRDYCYSSCSSDYECPGLEVCCGGDCADSCVWTAGSIAGAVIGTIIFFAIIISIVSCCCCACCPYYHYRTPGTVIVTSQQPYQQFVSTTSTTQQGVVQYPPPGSYNQPPPAYPPPGPNPYPPVQVQGQAVSMPPPGPVKY